MNTTDLELYNATAKASASIVIRRYSTSFGWASRLLDEDVRSDIARVYALVRIADELVDGPAETAGVDLRMRGLLLDELEAETARAIEVGYSTNLVVHAFALTARQHGIGMELCRPFFSSMRKDLHASSFDAAALNEYIYGSAEVVGLMCLAVFESDRVRTDDESAKLNNGARKLGSAFQKVNFLRDFADDRDDLGRAYLPGTTTALTLTLTEQSKAEVVASIRVDLRAADSAIALLEPGCRGAVWAARAMFGELTDRIESTPVSTLTHTRVRVPNPVKAGILARALRIKVHR